VLSIKNASELQFAATHQGTGTFKSGGAALNSTNLNNIVKTNTNRRDAQSIDQFINTMRMNEPKEN